jgi:starvation-inducible DNA-binding protein
MSVPEINIGIGAKEREAIANGLSRMLADSFVLYLKTHNYHWNVKGPMFQTLHILFMTQYTELWNALDEIAERIRSLGFPAPGTYKEFTRLSSIKESDGVPRAEDMIRDLIVCSETVTRTAREVLEVADSANDQPTVDLLTQRMQIHEKNAWMLRSLLDSDLVGSSPTPPKAKKSK